LYPSSIRHYTKYTMPTFLCLGTTALAWHNQQQ
jgi:hypothetical protein